MLLPFIKFYYNLLFYIFCKIYTFLIFLKIRKKIFFKKNKRKVNFLKREKHFFVKNSKYFLIYFKDHVRKRILKKKKFFFKSYFCYDYFLPNFRNFFLKKRKIRKKKKSKFLLIPLKYLKRKKLTKNQKLRKCKKYFFKKLFFKKKLKLYVRQMHFHLVFRKKKKKYLRYVYKFGKKKFLKKKKKFKLKFFLKRKIKLKFFLKRKHTHTSTFFFKKRNQKRSLRKFKRFISKKKIFIAKKKIFIYFKKNFKNNIINLLNIKYIKNIRLFLFYNNYVKFSGNKNVNFVKLRWTNKTPLIRLNFFYKLHLFMKSFRLQTLTYENIIFFKKHSIMPWLKTIKILYPLEYVWYREFSIIYTLIRFKIALYFKLSYWIVLNNFVRTITPVTQFTCITFNIFYFFLLNFFTLNLVKNNFLRFFKMIRFFRKIRYVHRKIIKLIFKNYYMQVFTNIHLIFYKFFEIDFKQLTWVLIFNKTLVWQSILFTWFNYWNARVFGWKFIT